MNKKSLKSILGLSLFFIFCFLFYSTKAQALPPDVDSLFKEANADFDSAMLIHETPIEPGNSEIQKIEKKLYYLGLGLKHQKEAKEGAFKSLEEKIDTLLLKEPYEGLPEDAQAYFDTSNIYFDSLIYVHSLIGKLNPVTDSFFQAANEWFDLSINIHTPEPYPPEIETLMIEQKLHYLKYALKDQKHAKMHAFEEIEAKLDTLLGWPYEGLPPWVYEAFDSANAYFDSVNWIHDQPWPEIEKIPWKLHYFKHALKWQKEAKHMMFMELEYKLDALNKIDFPGTLPADVESLFACANAHFDTVNVYFEGQDPPEMKIELMLYYLSKGLVCQKEAMFWMYLYLKEKIFLYSGSAYLEPPFELVDAYMRADSFFAQIESIHIQPPYPPIQNLEWKVFYLASGLKWEKEFKWLLFEEIKTELFEFDKVELKLHHLGKALDFQKHAKERMFEELEIKLDILLDQEYPGLPPDVEDFFDSANVYFALVETTHQRPDTLELAKIETKLYYLQYGFGWQKEAMRRMFEELEWKLDELLGWPQGELPQNVEVLFMCVDDYLDTVRQMHEDTQMPELMKVESKLYYLAHALKCEKEAKWNMFDTLEYKIDSLGTDIDETGDIETAPDKFTLLQNYPNPFNPETSIEFILNQPGRVTVEIFNILGQKIKTVADKKFRSGLQTLYWDGKDENGKEVSSGIYFYRVKTDDMVKTRKMVLVK